MVQRTDALTGNAGVRIDVDTRNLDTLITTLAPRLEAVVEKGGRDVEARAKEIIVEKDIIDTGATLNSTESRTTGRPFQRRIGPSTLYAPFLEFGTRFMAARPFMVPALESVRASVIAAAAAVFRIGATP